MFSAIAGNISPFILIRCAPIAIARCISMRAFQLIYFSPAKSGRPKQLHILELEADFLFAKPVRSANVSFLDCYNVSNVTGISVKLSIKIAMGKGIAVVVVVAVVLIVFLPFCAACMCQPDANTTFSCCAALAFCNHQINIKYSESQRKRDGFACTKPA